MRGLAPRGNVMADKPFHDRFKGRVSQTGRACAHTGCAEPGEFRAPNIYGRAASPNGPGDYQYLCLEHVRAFNARFNFFQGMTREEIEDAQMPAAGWANASRVFSDGGVDVPPKWSDFQDPLDAISARFRRGVAAGVAEARMRARAQAEQGRFTSEELRALKILDLTHNADRKALRTRYSERVRQYHPDRNGGDRRFEKKLQTVVEAYQLLRTSSVFKGS
jgi:DnaJ domain